MAHKVGKYKVSKRENFLDLQDAANNTPTTLTVSGETNLNGGLKMDTNKFTVANATGNTLVAGTLEVTNGVTLSSTLAANGHITIANAKNIICNTSTGTKIGTDAAQKIAFHNAAPVVQANHIADIANDANGTAIATAVNAILVVLEGKGFTATS